MIKYNTPINAKILLSVGELNDNKNQISVIRAMKLIEREDLHYWICGDGEQRSKLENEVQLLGLQNRVHFLGYLLDIPNLLKCIDLFVFPSFREGLGIALAEALMMGIPSIASNIRGPRDLLENEKYLFSPDNIGEIAMRIETVLSEDADQFQPISQNLRKNYSLQNVIGELMEIYEDK